MKPIRNNSIYVSDKTLYYAHILTKAKMNGIKGGEMTIDQLCDAELIDRWENLYPAIQAAYEKNCELKQRNKKEYEKAEQEAIQSLIPNPAGNL